MARPENYSFATLQEHIGHDFGRSDPILVDQDRINKFADATGDHQWIHVDIKRAKTQSPFDGTVAHGFLTLSLVAACIESSGVIPADAKAVFNYGVENLRFLAPVPSGAKVFASFSLKSVKDKGEGRKLITVTCRMDIAGGDKPALFGETLALVLG